MTQRQITHPAGQLPHCSCGREPKHYQDMRGRSKGGGHLFECNPSDRSTGKQPTAEEALREFTRLSGVPERSARSAPNISWKRS